MDIKKLQTVVVDALEDVKGQEIMLFDTTHLTSLFDRIAVVSGTSNRQTKALAASVRDKVKEAGGNVIGLEGEDTGEWVLVDLGDMIVHIMQPAIRQYYRLEEIWGEKPVKLGAAKRKSTAEAVDAEPKTKSKHLAANQDQPEAKPVNERKPAAKRASTVSKTSAAKTTATKTAAAKKPAAKKAPVGKTVKVAPSKSEIAAVEATKAKPPKRVTKAAAPADAEPVKKVIKRVARKAAE
ncbi:ribosome silencing factor [Massilia sp. Dwa41.01b]|uniref:ribosome silencing factor n=1 Tax=unclassified Massilia TaxID=2609279 RepID=UPI00160457D4|nr:MULTISPECIES: ribosome silencing factor [unclassified Massilia]QNA90299.1 ribosome silencing factor [Massilia sp. Dwa41.01b]QNB01199.1 ribosome silencing factor [Massilia sp. Se16.2.3]